MQILFNTGAPTGENGAPPAANIVIKSPRELELEAELAAAQQRALDAERTAAEAEDKAQQLIEIDRRRPAPGPSQPAKRKIKVPGNTFFHEEEEVEVDD